MSIIALFETSGYSLEPWAEAGFHCFAFDIKNDNSRKDFLSSGSITFIKWDATDDNAVSQVMQYNPEIIFGFPPCTDLAGSGAKHFSNKYKKDPLFQEKAMRLVLLTPKIGDLAACPWLFENPIGVVSSLYRKPDIIISPNDYGGYLPENDVHPKWPQYIEARDAYYKKTCIWKSPTMKLPNVKYITAKYVYGNFNKQTAYLGGKSEKTKEIRSMTPRGFFRGLFEVNAW